MVILDANILIYRADRESIHHERISKWLTTYLDKESWIGLPWVSRWGFLRVATNPKLFRNPLTIIEAFQVLRVWDSDPRVFRVEPGNRHIDLLETLMIRGQATGPLTSDAVLAALAIEHGAELASTDRDFSRFPGLRWVNPLD